jgi:methyl-accepting chemotaxis protein
MFRQLSLKAQLATGFAAVVLVFVFTLAVVATWLVQLEGGVRRTSQHSLPLVLALDGMDLARSEVQQFLTDVSATHDEAAYQEADRAAKTFRSAAASAAALLQAQGDTAAVNALNAVLARFEAFNTSGQRMARAYVAEGREAGNRLMKGSAGQPGFDQVSAALGEQLTALREQQLQQVQQGTASDLQAASRIQRVMLWGGLVATAVAALFGTLIVRIVLQQLGGEPRVAVQLAQRVGAGDLATPIRLRRGDSTSLLAQLQAMQEALRAVVGTVRDKAQGVAQASSEIEQGNADLSSRTATQAGSLEETAASMAQINGTVQQGAAGTQQARDMAARASATAEQADALVARFVDTMQGITQASGQIADIIGVIDGIAFQTNLLALNAAVEAARAGTQGRGFAVVAAEVRNLAGRSAEAAKAVKVLINTSVERVEQGSALVTQARAAMAGVVDGIRQVNHRMDDMARANGEQSAGVAQVTEAVRQMDQVTQHNAALVEQSAAAAAALRQQAQTLSQAVAVFRLSASPA